MREEGLYLGQEISTQSATAIVIDKDSVVDKVSVQFDAIQPGGYGLKDGVWSFQKTHEAFGSPYVWARGQAMTLSELDRRGLTGHVDAGSGAGQQHGHEALTLSTHSMASKLHAGRALEDQLIIMDAFARKRRIGNRWRKIGPIWQDQSTTEYLERIADSVGGKKKLIRLTGGAFERFSGPQFARFAAEFEEMYSSTAALPLISVMGNAIMGGGFVIPPGDGAGMCLMNLKTRQYDPRLVEATAPGLLEKLPRIVDPTSVTGRSNRFIKEQYNLNALCCPWEGDNPSSLIGVGAVEPGVVVISLGTSDTIFGHMGISAKVDLSGELAVFGAPTSMYDNMYLGCWQNGDKGRKKMAKDFFDGNWKKYSDYLLRTPPDTRMGVYWHDDEITPKASGGTFKRTLGFTGESDYNAKAIIDGKIMSMMNRLKKMGITPKEIYVTAGASENDGILQTIADISGATVYRQEVSDSSALGGALRARYAYLKQDGRDPNWKEVVSPFMKIAKTFDPIMVRNAIYKAMMPKYTQLEKAAVKEAR